MWGKLVALCLLSCTMVRRSLSALVVKVFGELNVIPPNPTFTTQCYKNTLNIIVKPNSFQNKQIVVFQFNVMLVNNLQPKVHQVSFIKFWFCHNDLNHYMGGTNKKYAFDGRTLLSLWHVQARTYFIQIKVLALEETKILLLEKLRCPFINQVGDDKFTPLNQPFTCIPWNLFGDAISSHFY